MNTETTETIRGWLFYDADCPFCTRWAWRTDEMLARRGWHLASLQADWVRERLQLAAKEIPERGPGLSLSAACGREVAPDGPLTEMKLLTVDGRLLGGADALVDVARTIWWAWPFFAFAQLPGITPVLRAIYRCIAKNRFCLGGRCPLPPKTAAPHRHLTSSFYDLS